MIENNCPGCGEPIGSAARCGKAACQPADRSYRPRAGERVWVRAFGSWRLVEVVRVTGKGFIGRYLKNTATGSRLIEGRESRWSIGYNHPLAENDRPRSNIGVEWRRP